MSEDWRPYTGPIRYPRGHIGNVLNINWHDGPRKPTPAEREQSEFDRLNAANRREREAFRRECEERERQELAESRRARLREELRWAQEHGFGDEQRRLTAELDDEQ
jgi:hypothetical protein